MINPINLIKLDEVKDSKGSTFHVGKLPDYDQEDYDLSNPKDFERFIKDVKSEVRGSFEYREMVKYLRNNAGMDRSGLSPDISNTDSKHIKIEIHHTPFTLEDIVRTVYEKRLFYHQDLSLEMVAKEVMECHYKCIVGLYPLTATEHELTHNGYLFIPPSNVFGRYDLFMKEYEQFLDPNDKETIEEIEAHEQSYDPKEQSQILAQSNIYIDPNGAYEVPMLGQFKDAVAKRIDTIRDNMYTLPVMSEQSKAKLESQQPVSTMQEAIYFVNENGDRVDNPPDSLG